MKYVFYKLPGLKIFSRNQVFYCSSAVRPDVFFIAYSFFMENMNNSITIPGIFLSELTRKNVQSRVLP